MLENAKDYILEMFFPSSCVLCDALGALLCENCRSGLLYIRQQSCPMCNRVSEKGRVCTSCRNKTALTGGVSCLHFKDERVKDVLHPYKYEGIFAMSGILSEMLASVIKEEGLKFDLVAFVPATKDGERKRGYNQAQIVAEEVANVFGKVVFSGLKKRRNIKTQVGLPRKERSLNIKDAFYVNNETDLSGKRVLIIDDVITTGATLSECAKELRGVGAREVWAATIAKE